MWREGEAPADTAWVRMTVESTGWLAETDFVELVRDEVPAHVRAELYVGDRRVWPAARGGDTVTAEPLAPARGRRRRTQTTP